MPRHTTGTIGTAAAFLMAAASAACGGTAPGPGAEDAARPAGSAARTAAPQDAGALPAPLAFWEEAAPSQLAQYTRPAPVATVEREADVPRAAAAEAADTAGAPADGTGAGGAHANTAVRLEILSSRLEPRLGDRAAPPGQAFLVLETRWENVHPKQMVDKASLEGRVDRTAGAGGLGRQSGPASAGRERVEMDVAYMIRRPVDHVYAVTGGRALALHEATESLTGGARLTGAFSIPKQGDVREARLAYLVPADAEHLALQFLDFEYGHILAPVRGDAAAARGDGGTPSGALGRADTAELELATYGVDLRDAHAGQDAPDGFRYALVQLTGRSLSARGTTGNIVELTRARHLWVTSDGGFVHFAEAPRSAGVIRFTPDIHQQQEAVFLVPADVERLRLGVRVRNDVVELPLTAAAPQPLPRARGTLRDEDVMEVLLFGSRREGDVTILDLGVRPLAGDRGLDLRPSQQFFAVAGGRDLRPDARATRALPRRPLDRVEVPPGVTVRFELAFRTPEAPQELRVRGFRSEGRLPL